MNTRVIGMAASAVMVLSSGAFAQDEPPSRLELFEAMEIQGSTAGPGGLVTVGHGADFSSLIHVRRSFLDEIIESADEISAQPIPAHAR